MGDCPFMQDCRQTKEKVQELEVNHATMAAQVESVAGCATRIEQSVEKALEAFNGTTKDLYSKYGQVKESVHVEETSRMIADRHIEEKVEEKTENRTARIIVYALTLIAIFISVFALLR